MSRLLQLLRRWRAAHHARSWGIPRWLLNPNTQVHVAAMLRANSVYYFGVSDLEWQEFVEAHAEDLRGAA